MEVQKVLEKTGDTHLSNFSKLFVDSSSIVTKVLDTIKEDTPIQVKMGNVICEGVNSQLDELRSLLKSGKRWIHTFQESLREELEIPKLKVGFIKIFGYYIEITKVHQEKVPDYFIRKQTLVNSERYITEELKEYEEKVLNSEEKIFSIESIPQPFSSYPKLGKQLCTNHTCS